MINKKDGLALIVKGLTIQLEKRPETFLFDEHYMTDKNTGWSVWIANGREFLRIKTPDKVNIDLDFINKFKLWGKIKKLKKQADERRFSDAISRFNFDYFRLGSISNFL